MDIIEAAGDEGRKRRIEAYEEFHGTISLNGSDAQKRPGGRPWRIARSALLDRQSQIFDRDGLDLNLSTLADRVGKSTALLEPLSDTMGRHVLSAEAIFADDSPISRMTRPSAPSHPAPARHRPRGSGPMPATNGPGAAMPGPPLGIASRVIVGATTPRTISTGSAAGCIPVAMPGSRTSISQALSARWPVWPMSGASSSTSTDRKALRSPKRPRSLMSNPAPRPCTGLFPAHQLAPRADRHPMRILLRRCTVAFLLQPFTVKAHAR